MKRAALRTRSSGPGWVALRVRPWARAGLAAGVILAVLALLYAVAFVVPAHLVSPANLPDKEKLLKAQNDVRTSLLAAFGGAVALLGGLVGGYVGLRQLHVNREGQITERFTRAIDQLGSKELDIRLGGIYALERIARGSSVDHGPIMEVLTTYVREHSPWPPARPGQYRAEASIAQIPELRLRGPDLQAVITVVGRRVVAHDSSGLDLSMSDLRRADLSGAHLEGADLSGTHLEGAKFLRAHLEGADLGGAHLEEAYLGGVHLEEAKLLWANLEGAEFFGAHLERAYLGGAHLEGAGFFDAHLEGADLGGAHLERADLSSAHGVTRSQILSSRTDETTQLPAGLGGTLAQSPADASESSDGEFGR